MALATSDARELVSELEFVWDQIKSNTSSSSASSPLGSLGLTAQQQQQQRGRSYASFAGASRIGGTTGAVDAPLRVLSPLSQDDNDELADEELEDDDAREGAMLRGSQVRDRRWRRRVEHALVKMTAELAALREQMESQRLYAWRRRRSFWAWMLWLCWYSVRHVLVDAALLASVLVWMRRRGDRRLEQSVAVLYHLAKERLRRIRWR